MKYETRTELEKFLGKLETELDCMDWFLIDLNLGEGKEDPEKLGKHAPSQAFRRQFLKSGV